MVARDTPKGISQKKAYDFLAAIMAEGDPLEGDFKQPCKTHKVLVVAKEKKSAPTTFEQLEVVNRGKFVNRIQGYQEQWKNAKAEKMEETYPYRVP